MPTFEILEDGFLTAPAARMATSGSFATPNTVFEEIQTLQNGVMASIMGGVNEYMTTGNTTMTQLLASPAVNVYFEAWNDPINYNTPAHKLATDEMNRVIAYFNGLGYNIRRIRNGTNNSFDWRIRW